MIRKLLIISLFYLLAATPLSFAEVGTAEQEGSSITVNENELELMIESAVSKRMRPLERQISEFRDEVRMSDILGGIGMIMGFAGLTFYFLGVRKKDKDQLNNNSGGSRQD